MVANTVRFSKYENGKWAWVADARKGENGQLYGPVGKWESFDAEIVKGGRRHGTGNFTAISDKDGLFCAGDGNMVQIVMRTKDYDNIPCRKVARYEAVCLQVLTSPLAYLRGCETCLEDIENLVKCYACKTVFSSLVEEELMRKQLEADLVEFRQAVAEEESIW